MSKSHNQSLLQLKKLVVPADNDTVGIWHFDRHLYSSRGAKPTGTPVVSYRHDGIFNGAVAVEEGTTNLYGDISNLGIVDANGTLSAEAYNQTYYGSPIVKVTKVASIPSAHASFRRCVTCLAGEDYVISWKIKVLSGSLSTIGRHFGGNTSGPINTYHYIGDGWYQYYYKSVAGSTTLCSGIGFVGEAAGEFLITEPQLEQKSFATSFVNGTRSIGDLRYSMLDVPLDKTKGTFSFWMNAHDALYTGSYYDMVDTGNRFIILRKSQNYNEPHRMFLRSGSTWISPIISGYIQPNKWHMYTWTWENGGQYGLYIDGNPIGTGAYTTGDMVPEYIAFGAGNYLLDEVRIDKIAHTSEEIKAWYLSQAPFYDPMDTTSISL